jgi:hypothetical protein
LTMMLLFSFPFPHQPFHCIYDFVNEPTIEIRSPSVGFAVATDSQRTTTS